MADTPKLRREQLQDEFGSPLSYAPGVEATQSNELPTKGYVDGIVAGALPRYDLTAQIDGITDVFVCPVAYSAGSLEVWLNGVYLGVPPRNFSENNDHLHFTITVRVPVVGEELVVRFLPA